MGLFDEIPVAEFRRVLEVNLLGAVYGIKAALPYLGAAGGGVLVNNASVLAEVAMPYQSAYNATKHGIRGLADTVRQELRVTGRGNISVCTVLPATIDTPFFRHAAQPQRPGAGAAASDLPAGGGRRDHRPAAAPAPPRGVRRWRGPADRPAVAAGARRWPSGPSAGTPTAPSSGRAPGWTAPATSSTPMPQARQDGGWHGRRRQLVRMTAAFGLAAAGTAVGTAGGDDPPIPDGPLMADVERPDALTVTGAHNGAIMPTDVRCLVETDESSAVVRLTGVLDAAGADAVRGALLARLCGPARPGGGRPDRPAGGRPGRRGASSPTCAGRSPTGPPRTCCCCDPAVDGPARPDAALAGVPAWPTLDGALAALAGDAAGGGAHRRPGPGGRRRPAGPRAGHRRLRPLGHADAGRARRASRSPRWSTTWSRTPGPR